MRLIKKYNIDLFFVNLLLTIKLWFIVTFLSKNINYNGSNLELTNWELTFNDEFDTGALDRTKWNTAGVYGNVYGDPPISLFVDENVIVNEDGLNLICKREEHKVTKDDYPDWGVAPDNLITYFKSGQIQSSESFLQKYGRFEIRCKMPAGRGMWCAFWLIGKLSYPPEIDIFETYTSKKLDYIETTHWWNTNDDRRKKTQGFKIKDMATKFCTYTCVWEEDILIYYWNDILVYKQRKGVYNDGDGTIQHIGNEPMFIIVNTAIQPEVLTTYEANLPNSFIVDYIRVYKKS